ncbi:NUDIX hydrolase [Pseudoclavibacter endophyticus]|uniref:NUDIX hydrolase n=1 Tax=Pseudoclavibacter endophyticus TaxID=1778590 RepID=UPI001CE46BF6|nr:CoA pyrophosphatase [Pseudoclavibacter endophyticus]
MTEHQHPQPQTEGARRQLAAATAALDWRGRLPELPDVEAAREAAVLMLFGVLDRVPAMTPDAAVARDLDVLLQRRAPTLASHPGEISFPGGRREPTDANAAATALREAEEETGLDPTSVEVLATLPDAPLLASNHRVTPVLGWWTAPTRVAAVDHAETVEVLRVPVAQLLNPGARFTTVVRFGTRAFRGPAFDIDGLVVWGFTAMLLDRLFDAAGWTVPWDTADEREVVRRGSSPVDPPPPRPANRGEHSENGHGVGPEA